MVSNTKRQQLAAAPKLVFLHAKDKSPFKMCNQMKACCKAKSLGWFCLPAIGGVVGLVVDKLQPARLSTLSLVLFNFSKPCPAEQGPGTTTWK